GDNGKVQLGVLQDRFVTLPKGRQADVKARYELTQKYLEAPLAKGQVVGKVIYQLDGKDIAQVDLQVMNEVAEGGFFGKAWDWLVLTVKSLFS
ncbi:serine-type D-Ala-D-Ala carboxypeptidase, partial [Avibacterium paragallinarum]